MRPPSSSRLAVCVALGVSLACVKGGNAHGVPRPDPSLITRTQIVQYQFRDAFDAVQGLHSQWMVTRGTNSFRNPTRVLVYLDGTRIGGIEMLRQIATPSIAYIRHFDAIAATARWGLNHGQGVIFVSTRG